MISPISIVEHIDQARTKRVGKACDSCRLKKTKVSLIDSLFFQFLERSERLELNEIER